MPPAALKSEVKTLLTGFGESPRWRCDRLWLTDWGAQEIVAVDPDGNRDVMVQMSFPSFLLSVDCRMGVCWSSRLVSERTSPPPGTRRGAGDPCRSSWPS